MRLVTLNLSSRPTFSCGRALARAGVMVLLVGVLVNLAGLPELAGACGAAALLLSSAAAGLLLVAAGDQLGRLASLVAPATSLSTQIFSLARRVLSRAAPPAPPPPRRGLLV